MNGHYTSMTAGSWVTDRQQVVGERASISERCSLPFTLGNPQRGVCPTRGSMAVKVDEVEVRDCHVHLGYTICQTREQCYPSQVLCHAAHAIQNHAYCSELQAGLHFIAGIAQRDRHG